MKKIKAFTLAEVLITLVVIGVVAALTIPTVVTNYKKHQYVTQLKKTYSQITNGLRTAMGKDGVTRLSDTSLLTSIPASIFVPQQVTIDYRGRQIITPEHYQPVSSIGPDKMLNSEFSNFKNEFEKVFKVIEIHGNNNPVTDYSYKFLKHWNAQPIGFATGIFLADGTFIDFQFQRTPYYINLPAKDQDMGWILIDVNGEKGPNVDGRDVFWFELNNDGHLYPFYGKEYAAMYGCTDLNSCNYYWKTSNSGCNPEERENTTGEGCAARIMEEGWKMKY